MKKYIAEFFGTFVLAITVLLSLTGPAPLITPILAALVLGLFVYTIGNVSGTHINPAVTVGAWSVRDISTRDAAFYITAQVIGGLVALWLSLEFIGVPDIVVGGSLQVFLAEFFGMMIFTFGIAAVVFGEVPESMGGIVIGGSLLLGISIAAMIGSNGVLNPAVGLAIGSINLTYVAGAIIGSIAGMWLCGSLLKE